MLLFEQLHTKLIHCLHLHAKTIPLDFLIPTMFVFIIKFSSFFFSIEIVAVKEEKWKEKKKSKLMLQNDERRKREHRFLFPQLSLQTTYENHFIHFVHFTNLDKL